MEHEGSLPCSPVTKFSPEPVKCNPRPTCFISIYILSSNLRLHLLPDAVSSLPVCWQNVCMYFSSPQRKLEGNVREGFESSGNHRANECPLLVETHWEGHVHSDCYSAIYSGTRVQYDEPVLLCCGINCTFPEAQESSYASLRNNPTHKIIVIPRLFAFLRLLSTAHFCALIISLRRPTTYCVLALSFQEAGNCQIFKGIHAGNNLRI